MSWLMRKTCQQNTNKHMMLLCVVLEGEIDHHLKHVLLDACTTSYIHTYLLISYLYRYKSEEYNSMMGVHMGGG